MPVAVGYVLKMFPRLSETFILNEILELERQGVALRVFSLKRPVEKVSHAQASRVRSPITYLPETMHHAPLRIAQGQLHAWSRHRRAWRHALRNALRRLRADGNLSDLLALCQACCLVREMRGIGHLHAHYANVPARIALLVRRLTGTSYSITTHAKDIFQNNPFASPRLQERMCQAQFVVANSRFSAGHIRSCLGGQAEIHTVYNGLDLAAFPMRVQAPTDPLILSVGRLVEKKGFSDLIAACQLLKQRGLNFTCELVGTGRLSSQLKEEIRSRGVGDRIKMLGPLPQEVLREHYRQAMVFALPCIQAPDGDRDILPNVVKEALAAGVPVVTSRLDGIEDSVSGLLVAPGDAHALATKLELLLHDTQLRERLATQGRKVIEEKFARRANVAQLKTLLLQAMHQPPAEAADTTTSEPRSDHANCLR